MNGVNMTVIAVAIGILFTASATFAWTAVWHDPAGWVINGAIVQSDKLGQTLQYLYEATVSRQDTLSNLNCPIGNVARWNGSAWVCSASCI